MQPETLSRSRDLPASQRGRRISATSRLLVAVCSAIVIVTAGCREGSPTAANPPSGRSEYVLDYKVFAAQVDPILTRLGCDDMGCHAGGPGGSFELSPYDHKDVAFDFAQACDQVYPPIPDLSALVMKPLDPACGGPGHGGGSFFHSLDDPDYLAILAWIEAAEYR